jgi:hypothetical protein
MNLFEIEIGRSYKCDRPDGQYVGTVKEKHDGQMEWLSVTRSGQVAVLAIRWPRELTWLAPNHIHPV